MTMKMVKPRKVIGEKNRKRKKSGKVASNQCISQHISVWLAYKLFAVGSLNQNGQANVVGNRLPRQSDTQWENSNK